MSLKDFVANGIQARAFRAPTLPKVSAMAKVAEKIAEAWDGKAEMIALDLDKLHARLRSFTDAANWRQLSFIELRHVPSCLWREDAILLKDRGFLKRYFDTLRTAKSRLATKELIWTYLSHFDPADQAIREVGTYLGVAVEMLMPEWSARHRTHSIFHPDSGPKAVALAALSTDQPADFLPSIGLRGPLASSQFALACFVQAADATAKQLRKAPSLELAKRLCAWADGANGSGPLSSGRKYLADALLSPWVDGDPPDDIRDFVRNAMIKLCGDPRVDKHGWIGVSDTARRVINRWMARASLEHFFAVVDRTALEHQWEARKAFWRRYIDEDYVRDAYVIFGATGQARARRIAQDEADPSALLFGALKGAYPDQAVLFLKIGELTVADWSHNGSLRVWKADNKTAPELHRSTYYAADLRTGANFEQRHMGYWQYAARTFIENNSGMR